MAHQPVLLNEVLEFLDPQPGDFIIDGTVDGGGHAAAIIARIAPNGTLLGLDWDKNLLEQTQKRFPQKNVLLRHSNYADIPRILEAEKLEIGRAHV